MQIDDDLAHAASLHIHQPRPGVTFEADEYDEATLARASDAAQAALNAAALGLPRSATLQNAAEVDGELATLASLWDSVRDDVVREEAPVSEEHLEKLIDNWQLVVRVQAAFRGALARARKKRGALRPMRRTRRTTTVRESGGGGAGIGAHRGSVQPKTFSFGM